jgi:hypothetical protein
MKAYYYEINEYIRGVTEARNRWDAKRHCKHLATIFCPNAKIRSLRVSKIRANKPLAVEA